MSGELLTFPAADARLGGALVDFDDEYDAVWFIDGDLTVDGDFLDALEDMGVPEEYDLVVITGDLTVRGPIELDAHYPGLYVGGHTRAESLATGDAEIRLHDATITLFVHGYHNDSSLFADTVRTPWLIRDGHSMACHAVGGIVVENFYRDAEADITRAEIPARFIPEVIDPEDQTLDVEALLDRIRAGEPVLRAEG